KVGAQKFLGFEGDWRMITFDMVLPLSLVGFFASVSGALADAGVNIFAISAYTTDHVFVKNQKLDIAIKTLEKLGMSVRKL
ncbi:MAG: ACT domain-containing protein, partial [Candidatus Aminicenantes bacterium]|nr:ACT domain-containing protein [Candidatus Aminicenantes bacterium]